jgi:drug/metabolite transporter (DMT)-like permease
VNKNNQQNHLAVFGLLFGAFCWGIVWYPYRLMAQAGVSGVASSVYTYAIAIVLACLFLRVNWRNALQQPLIIIPLGLMSGYTNLSYVLAVIDGDVMRVMLLFYLSPIWTLILAHFWLKEKTHIIGYVAVFISILGAFVMLYDPHLGGLPVPKNTAEWLALSSGIGFAVTNVIARKAQQLSLMAKSFSVWIGVFSVSILYMLYQDGTVLSPVFFNVRHWLIMLLISLLLMAATGFVQYGVTRMPATRASILFLFELVVAAIASYYLTNTSMAWNEWLGGILIMLAAVFAAGQPEQVGEKS